MEDKRKDELINALKSIKESPEDRIGIIGKVGITGLGVAGGVAGAGAVAGIFGASTIFGSSTIGAVFGGTLVAATPVGWVLGVAALGGAAAYGISTLIDSGGEMNERKKQNIKEIEAEIIRLDKEQHSSSATENDKISKLAEMYEILVTNGILEDEKVIETILTGIHNGDIDIDSAFENAKSMMELIEQEINSEKDNESPEEKKLSELKTIYDELLEKQIFKSKIQANILLSSIENGATNLDDALEEAKNILEVGK